MKNIILSLILVFCFVGIAQADFVVLYNNSTGEVLSIADKADSFIISETDKAKLSVKQIKGEVSDYDLTEAWTDYKLSGSKFILNTAKISAKENAKEDYEKIESDRQKSLDSAKEKLINLGLTPQECDAFLK